MAGLHWILRGPVVRRESLFPDRPSPAGVDSLTELSDGQFESHHYTPRPGTFNAVLAGSSPARLTISINPSGFIIGWRMLRVRARWLGGLFISVRLRPYRRSSSL